MDTIRWGILGTGKIAHLFAEDLLLLPDADLAAVASPLEAAAASWAIRTRIVLRALARHPDWLVVAYEDLARDPLDCGRIEAKALIAHQGLARNFQHDAFIGCCGGGIACGHDILVQTGGRPQIGPKPPMGD
mgnify:CR=1 FL=1